MRALVIGVGGAGNKAAINLVREGVIPEEDLLLINTTLKDVDPDFRAKAKKIGSAIIDGSGKERDVAVNCVLESLKDGSLDLESYVNPEHDFVILIASTEGGSGSGAAPILAQYITSQMDMHVHLVAFTGFESDPRGLRNTVEFFRNDLDDCAIQIICNTKFMKEANQNIQKAEKMANDYLAQSVKVLLGNIVFDSDQNADGRDFKKSVCIPGLMSIEFKTLDEKLKNRDIFEAFMNDMMDSSKTIDCTSPYMKRLCTIVNVHPERRDGIDMLFNVVKNRLGKPYEHFNHIEYDETGECPEFIAYIAGGMNMPFDEIKAIYDRYEQETAKVNKSKDSFFDKMKSLSGNAEDSIFDDGEKRGAKKKGNFFDKFESTPEKDPMGKF